MKYSTRPAQSKQTPKNPPCTPSLLPKHHVPRINALFDSDAIQVFKSKYLDNFARFYLLKIVLHVPRFVARGVQKLGVEETDYNGKYY
ncbi:hypothetical protein GDO78_012931 [Eleutherodactylus coqui]|uniref:Uncharacterized protein n=1 Tax=Eleutherodactylus coqui TaxID=57060 RepID=A0A8J6K2Y9_ELECQ|nr:hypothetical protein GDO78_012931 [Eleutherodactylus coqui]